MGSNVGNPFHAQFLDDNLPSSHPFARNFGATHNQRELAIRRLVSPFLPNEEVGVSSNPASCFQMPGPDDLQDQSGMQGFSQGLSDLQALYTLYSNANAGSIPTTSSPPSAAGRSLADLIPKLPSLSGSLGLAANFGAGPFGMSFKDFPQMLMPPNPGTSTQPSGVFDIASLLTAPTDAGADALCMPDKKQEDNSEIPKLDVKAEPTSEPCSSEPYRTKRGRATKQQNWKRHGGEETDSDYEGSSDLSVDPAGKRKKSGQAHKRSAGALTSADAKKAKKAPAAVAANFSHQAANSTGMSAGHPDTAGDTHSKDTGTSGRDAGTREQRALNKRNLNREAQRRFRSRQRAAFDDAEKRGAALQQELTVLRVQHKLLNEQYKSLSDNFNSLQMKLMQAQMRLGIVL